MIKAMRSSALVGLWRPSMKNTCIDLYERFHFLRSQTILFKTSSQGEGLTRSCEIQYHSNRAMYRFLQMCFQSHIEIPLAQRTGESKYFQNSFAHDLPDSAFCPKIRKCLAQIITSQKTQSNHTQNHLKHTSIS